MKKEKLSERILDGVLELILSVVLFGIGFGCVKFFNLGKWFDVAEDFDIICLLGVLFLVVVVTISYYILKTLRKIKEKNREENDK